MPFNQKPSVIYRQTTSTEVISDIDENISEIVAFPKSRPYPVADYPPMTRNQKVESIQDVKRALGLEESRFRIFVPGARFVASLIYILTTQTVRFFGIEVGPISKETAWFLALAYAGADIANEIFEAQGIDATAYDAENLWVLLPPGVQKIAEFAKEKLPSPDRRKVVCYVWDYLRPTAGNGGMNRPGTSENTGNEMTTYNQNSGCAAQSAILIFCILSSIGGIAYAAM